MTDFGRRPPAHYTTHQDAGDDEISVAALSGELADEQPSAWTKVSGKPAFYPPESHHADHEYGMPDMMNIIMLVGKSFVVDKGDFSAYHFTKDDLTTDGNWHDLDLEPHISSHATHAMLYVLIADNAVDSDLVIREKGNNNIRNIFRLRTQVANVKNDAQGIVAVDDSQLLEYKTTNTTWTLINIAVIGWIGL